MKTFVGIVLLTWGCLSSTHNYGVNGFSVGTSFSSLSKISTASRIVSSPSCRSSNATGGSRRTTSKCIMTRRPPTTTLAASTSTHNHHHNNNGRGGGGRFVSMLRQRIMMVHRNSNRKQILLTKFRRAVALVWTASFLYVGGARLSTLPSHASSTTTTTTPLTHVRMVSAATTTTAASSSSSLDSMVDRYVQHHMFDTDQYDPVESAYREAYADATTGEYPAALQEIQKDILGKQKGGAVSSLSSSSTSLGEASKEGSDGLSALIFGKLRWAAGFLQTQFGMKESMAYILMGMSTIAILPIIAAYLLLSYSAAQKNVIQRSNKKRYGADYSLDATIKEDDDVEAPDDDDDEDDDDDDDEDDDE